MRHLTPDQFIDSLDALDAIDAIDETDAKVALPRAASAHLAGCEACQAERASLAEALGDARAVAMPEPSPLFWDNFSRRVGAATSDEAVPRSMTIGGLWRRGWRPFATVAVAACALALVVVMRGGPRLDDSGGVAVPAVAELTPAAAPVGFVGMDDGSLSVVAAVAADLKTDELQQVARPSADATGAAMEDLTPAQCAELMRLIKTQMSGAE
jgi:hypothetical protein